MTGDFTASYISLMGLGEILGEDVVQITEAHPGDYQPYGYVTAGSAHGLDGHPDAEPAAAVPGRRRERARVRRHHGDPAMAKTCASMRANDATYVCIHPTELGGQGLTPTSTTA